MINNRLRVAYLTSDFVDDIGGISQTYRELTKRIAAHHDVLVVYLCRADSRTESFPMIWTCYNNEWPAHRGNLLRLIHYPSSIVMRQFLN